MVDLAQRDIAIERGQGSAAQELAQLYAPEGIHSIPAIFDSVARVALMNMPRSPTTITVSSLNWVLSLCNCAFTVAWSVTLPGQTEIDTGRPLLLHKSPNAT